MPRERRVYDSLASAALAHFIDMDHRPDVPKLLGHPSAQRERAAQLDLPHMAPLRVLAARIRHDRGPGARVPDFDPWDGGVDAEILLLLEAPGPRAIQSGFVSRNNPDESARNFHLANVAAGIPRRATVSWNIVPWSLREGSRGRSATAADVAEGMPYLRDLLALLPRLRAVVLVGRKAETAREMLRRERPDLQLFVTPHPSPQFVNRSPGNRAILVEALRDAARRLGY